MVGIRPESIHDTFLQPAIGHEKESVCRENCCDFDNMWT
jgi:hypothetical protein